MHRFNYRYCWMLLGVLAVLPILGQGQTRTGSISMTAAVSEIVSLSPGPEKPPDNLRIETLGPKALTLTLSGSATDLMKVRVPILIRSNTGYKISALVRSEAATLANFLVVEAQPLGRFVATDAIANLKVPSRFDHRDITLEVETTAPNSLPLNSSTPVSILSGSRVSTAGTLQSADNALQVVIFIAVQPDPGARNWLLTLTLSGSATDGL